jgi:glyoxylase-like metal-dependent hydrolase (beta-lactamase superfamily II)
MSKKVFQQVIEVIILLVGLNTAALGADSGKTTERTVTKLVEGVYVIRHKDAPDTFPQGNTTVIIGEREVLVVDSCYLPSSAKEDIAQIRQWTNKPVRYLVNTHWHFDHTMGNGTYWEAFAPMLTIIAHAETAKQSKGYNPGWFERFPRRADIFRRILENGKDNNGKVLTDGEKKEYADAIAGIEPVQAEFKTITDRAPNLTFSDELSVDLGNREVQIRYLGRGNTAGDAIVYLPQEKILITGDLLVSPVPYLFGGYPADFVKTLERLAWFDAQITVPGHGNVFRGDAGKAYITQVHDFLKTVVTQVSSETFRLGSGTRNLEAVREAVNKNPEINVWRRKFASDVKDEQDFFDTTLAALIAASHAEIAGR